LRYKIYSSAQVLQRYGDNPGAIIDAATRTSKFWNAGAADAVGGGLVNMNTLDCDCQ